jgi:hypothetical protein
MITFCLYLEVKPWAPGLLVYSLIWVELSTGRHRQVWIGTLAFEMCFFANIPKIFSALTHFRTVNNSLPHTSFRWPNNEGIHVNIWGGQRCDTWLLQNTWRHLEVSLFTRIHFSQNEIWGGSLFPPVFSTARPAAREMYDEPRTVSLLREQYR